ncbi:GTP-binding protein [Chitinolyticbacter albus]|uniref:GTP-binding protein n=1 Tax=Chitinolyticbacter albus TaxID=2961951 RepID=UPI00210B2BAC|nr:GTP-binding protein [Chitinolyticbacter albus]
MNIFQALIVATVFCLIAGSSVANEIVFLGDEIRLDVLKKCGAECQSSRIKVGTPSRGATASEVANSAQSARHAIIVVDAASGPLQITREHILIARQAGVPSLSVMFVNMPLLEGMRDANELVELEEFEVRELMNKYEMGGNTAMVFHDASIRSIPKLHTNGVGTKAILSKTLSLPARKVVSLEKFSGRTLHAYLYLLTKLESKYTAVLNKGSAVAVWINGQSVSAVVKSARSLSPGGNDELMFEAQTPINAPLGSRLLLELKGEIVAAGVLSRGG